MRPGHRGAGLHGEQQRHPRAALRERGVLGRRPGQERLAEGGSWGLLGMGFGLLKKQDAEICALPPLVGWIRGLSLFCLFVGGLGPEFFFF